MPTYEDSDFHFEAETILPDIFLPCRKCGKDHRNGVKNMVTGEFTSIDICSDCFVFGRFEPITEKVHLSVEDFMKRIIKAND